MVEIELKYAIPDRNTAENILQAPCLTEIEEPGSRENLDFKAVYFDTDDMLLAANGIAYRIRLEGLHPAATLKFGGKCEGALHTREEINVPLKSGACLTKPDPSVFKESSAGRLMLELIGERSLSKVMEISFQRRRIKVSTGKSIIEISVDTGDIITASGSEPVCELELELFSGDKDELIGLGEKIAGLYSLIPESRSKYARGLVLNGSLKNN